MESNQVKLENLGTWLSDIFFSFLLTFLQGVQRNNLAIQRAVNNREGNLGWGSSMVKAWREPEEIHRLAERLLFADTIEGTGSKRCVDACHLLCPFPLPDGTSTGETAAHRDEVEARGKGPLHPMVPYLPSGSCVALWARPVMGIAVVFCKRALTEMGSSGGSKLWFFPVSFTHSSLHLKTELLN